MHPHPKQNPNDWSLGSSPKICRSHSAAEDVSVRRHPAWRANRSESSVAPPCCGHSLHYIPVVTHCCKSSNSVSIRDQIDGNVPIVLVDRNVASAWWRHRPVNGREQLGALSRQKKRIKINLYFINCRSYICKIRRESLMLASYYMVWISERNKIKYQTNYNFNFNKNNFSICNNISQFTFKHTTNASYELVLYKLLGYKPLRFHFIEIFRLSLHPFQDS